MDFWHLLGIAPASVAALALVAGLVPPTARGVLAAGLAAAAMLRALPLVSVLATLATPDAGPHLDRVDLRWDLLTPPALAAIPRVVEAVGDKRRVAGFPATGVVNFALGRPSPWRHDYFFPGRPDAGEEAALVATLAREPPDAVVVLASGDAFSAPAFAAHAPLVAAIERRCRETQTIGPYRILVPEPPP
jgi:hypothetical protein